MHVDAYEHFKEVSTIAESTSNCTSSEDVKANNGAPTKQLGGEASETSSQHATRDISKSAEIIGNTTFQPHASLSFGHVALGGTFDRLHAGHRLLLAAAVMMTNNEIYIGITGTESPFLVVQKQMPVYSLHLSGPKLTKRQVP